MVKQFEVLVAELDAVKSLAEQLRMARKLCMEALKQVHILQDENKRLDCELDKALAKANMANIKVKEQDETISSLHRRLNAHIEYEKVLLDERDEMRLQLSKYRLLSGTKDTMMVIHGESGPAVLYQGELDDTGNVVYSIHDCVKGRWSKNPLPGADRCSMSLNAWLDLRKSSAIYGINE